MSKSVIDFFLPPAPQFLYDESLYTQIETGMAPWPMRERIARTTGITCSFFLSGTLAALTIIEEPTITGTTRYTGILFLVLVVVSTASFFILSIEAIHMPRALIGSDFCPRKYLRGFGLAFLLDLIALVLVVVVISARESGKPADTTSTAGGFAVVALCCLLAALSALATIVNDLHPPGWYVGEDRISCSGFDKKELY